MTEYRLIYEKIDNNCNPSKCRFWNSKFETSLEASRHKMKQPRPKKLSNLEIQHQNICWQQLEQFVLIHLQIIRPTFKDTKNRSKETLYLCDIQDILMLSKFKETRRLGKKIRVPDGIWTHDPQWSSWMPARGSSRMPCGSSEYPQFDPCSPQSLQWLSGRASD